MILYARQIAQWYHGQCAFKDHFFKRGMALLGYLRNFLTSTQSAGNLGYGNGIVKYVASQKDDTHGLSKILSSAVLVSLGASVFIGVALFFGAEFWNSLPFPLLLQMELYWQL